MVRKFYLQLSLLLHPLSVPDRSGLLIDVAYFFLVSSMVVVQVWFSKYMLMKKKGIAY
jgi:hypothetical protein